MHLAILISNPKNIAFDFAEDKISGIYDFGDCGFCDISYDFTKFAIQYNPEILNNVLKHYQNLSGLKLNVPAILSNSTYCVLHCLMKDIEKTLPGQRAVRITSENIATGKFSLLTVKSFGFCISVPLFAQKSIPNRLIG